MQAQYGMQSGPEFNQLSMMEGEKEEIWDACDIPMTELKLRKEVGTGRGMMHSENFLSSIDYKKDWTL